MRGKPTIEKTQSIKHRITPADAGKTSQFSQVPYILQDHPRGCGENTVALVGEMVTLGSPPRMRGKQNICRYTGYCNGITPADAGKTSTSLKKSRPNKDHPRGCGENTLIIFQQWRNAGSPPQVRGKRAVVCGGIQGRRITPAGAGKTQISVHS